MWSRSGAYTVIQHYSTLRDEKTDGLFTSPKAFQSFAVGVSQRIFGDKDSPRRGVATPGAEA